MSRNYSFRVLLAFLALVSIAGFAWAQQPGTNNTPVDVTERVFELEAKVVLLESEVVRLRERLDALVGSRPEDRVQDVPVGDSPVRGRPDAPITLVMFGDYQSDYTARAQHVVARLLETFPDEVRYVFKHYPLTQIHPLANEAALAAVAAEKQYLFWEYHEQLFLNARRLNSPLLLVLAEQVGLDLNRFNEDRRSLEALERLAADEKLAATLSVTGLPTLYLNGRQLSTWRFDHLDEQVKKLLP